ncbi:hypothetical protein BKI51_10310 [Alphaproteobacteria bacterium AO1-B]|nr:hypothetical protein BKI51_10310 [Alphaproteobacteria bacterium AO1-B]
MYGFPRTGNMTAVSPQHRIARICVLIESDLSRPWRIDQLADACAMAQHHFQRRFAAATGETVAGYVKSRRLEKAARLLSRSNMRVLDIALECGFQTHAALTRAFSAHFGLSPAAFRDKGLPEHLQGMPPRPFLRPLASRGLSVDFDLIDLPPQWLHWRKATGMVDGRYFPDLKSVGKAFWALRQELGSRKAHLATGFINGPRAFLDDTAVAYFGALLSDRTDLDWADGANLLEAGLYAVFPHYGPLTTLHLTWHKCVRAGVEQHKLTFAKTWMFETYLIDTVFAKPEKLSALIHLPVHKGTIGQTPPVPVP